ncbi:hypothetical protein BIT28_23965 [Photobacterium proteolyticum]|uniref:Uncharacterized protein n=1 Tax=Photobacterium proteolyticum TaxID=1903952 RepID=A0A1Q9GBI3_9GAMM|nr:hypothetical protein BIT28_23965 [Photobacterium proteolyticum]
MSLGNCVIVSEFSATIDEDPLELHAVRVTDNTQTKLIFVILFIVDQTMLLINKFKLFFQDFKL